MKVLPQHIFVTGIGTGVGKTITSAVLTEALHADYWKPVQCGNLEDSDSHSIKSLINNEVSRIYPEAFRLRTASSPHYAARLEGVQIEIDNLAIPNTQNRLVIEGAGGLMVPLNDHNCIVDVIEKLGAPVVLVCRNYLGAINHALLSVALLKQRKITLLGLIFSGDNFLDNEEIILSISGSVVLGRIDESQNIDKSFINGQALNLRSSISKYYSL